MDAAPPAPSRTRLGVIYFGVALAVIQYVDRVCIGQASDDIQASLHLVKAQMGYVFGAFALAYALFEVPTGWLGDKFGPRKTLLRVVLWWSFFTAATGWVWSRWSLIVTRFLFGAGEAGCFPNLTRVFATWLQPGEKVRAQAILWFCARWGGAVTPLLVALFLKVVNWRVAFGVFGSLGVVWAFFFYHWFRDNPKDHPQVNEAEQALLAGNPPVARHDAVPWKRFCSSRTTWLLWLQYFCFSYCWYFFVTWLPSFLRDNYKSDFNSLQLAMLAGVPLFGGGFGNLLGGFFTARLNAWTGSLARTRKTLSFVGFTLAGLAFVIPSRTDNLLIIMLALGFASLVGDLSMPCSWGACMDVGGKFSGTFAGSMNMMGNLGGAVGPVVAGYISWNHGFIVSAGVYFVGALCWLFIDPVTPLDREPEAAVSPAT
jgi:ACS family glucarate transporter-like MFS transporter